MTLSQCWAKGKRVLAVLVEFCYSPSLVVWAMFCHYLPVNQEVFHLEWKGKEIRLLSMKTITPNIIQEICYIWTGNTALLLMGKVILLSPQPQTTFYYIY